ncbi:hypothetical protein VB773_19615 [Haloarculaceae archaeon H-GB2-1]|nr:hypothetical protein [Haloarculaceae archaeon H-GB1-1]MEA5409568.1 hypothetical protein [Haloarculaceae archaeon H-GB2-1]
MSTSGDDESSQERPHVPAPLPPDDPEAWYAPDVLSQYSVYPGVVVTITQTGTGFAYDVVELAETHAINDRAANQQH